MSLMSVTVFTPRMSHRGRISRKQVRGVDIFQLRALFIQLCFNFMTAKTCNYSVGTPFAFQFTWDFDVAWGYLNIECSSLLCNGFFGWLVRVFSKFRGILDCFCVYTVLDYPAPHLNARCLQIEVVIACNFFSKASLDSAVLSTEIFSSLSSDKFFVLRLDLSFQIC